MAHGWPDYAPLATSAAAELPTYRVAPEADFTAASGARWVLSVFNPAGSGQLAKLRRLHVGMRFGASADGVATPNLGCWRTTSLGTGDVLNPTNHDPQGPASALSVRTNLTVDPVNTDLFLNFRTRFERKADLQPSRMSLPTLFFDLYAQASASQQQPIHLPPGFGFAIYVTAPGFVVDITPVPEWTEEPYTV